MSDRTETLEEAMNAAVEGGLRELFTCAPARVVKVYDSPTGQKVDCQPLVKSVTRGEDGAREVKSFPVVTGVPVQFFGSGEMRITLPISSGDGGSKATLGTLFFSHRSLDKWLSGDGREVDPEFDHAHAMTDAIFMPGLMPFGAAWQTCPNDAISIGHDTDGNGRIHLKKSEIQLGDGASKGVAREEDTTACGQLELIGGISNAFGGLKYTAPDGTITTITAAGVPINLAGEIDSASGHIKAVD